MQPVLLNPAIVLLLAVLALPKNLEAQESSPRSKADLRHCLEENSVYDLAYQLKERGYTMMQQLANLERGTNVPSLDLKIRAVRYVYSFRTRFKSKEDVLMEVFDECMMKRRVESVFDR